MAAPGVLSAALPPSCVRVPRRGALRACPRAAPARRPAARAAPLAPPLRAAASSAAAAAAAAAPLPPPRLADPLLVGIGVDEVGTGGTYFPQSALTDALVEAITSGRLACDASSLGEGAAAQAASARELFAASGVRRRGSQRRAAEFFVTTPGLPPLAAAALLERLESAASRALARWTACGGEGAAGITHLVLGSLTPPRSAPGARGCSARAAFACVLPATAAARRGVRARRSSAPRGLR
jgi:hypothetical protein